MKSRYTITQQIARKFKFSISAMLSLIFSPNYTRPTSWWEIFGFISVLVILLFISINKYIL